MTGCFFDRPYFALWLLGALFAPSATFAAQSQICVINQTPDTLYFEIATWTKTQQREVAPTSKFCVEGDSSGEIKVSDTPEAYDYCEHLIQPAETELLLRYNFGMCQWAKFIPDS